MMSTPPPHSTDSPETPFPRIPRALRDGCRGGEPAVIYLRIRGGLVMRGRLLLWLP